MTPINIPMNRMRIGLLRPLRPLQVCLHVLMQILPPSRSENSFEKLRHVSKRLNLLRPIFQAAARRHKNRSPTPLARSPLRQLPPELYTARAPGSGSAVRAARSQSARPNTAAAWPGPSNFEILSYRLRPSYRVRKVPLCANPSKTVIHSTKI